MQQLVLIRGLPGSGKSTMAKTMAASMHAIHIEADMYFTNTVTGEYTYDPAKIKEAHEFCRSEAFRNLQDGYTVIVSNTFTRLWELQPYIDMSNKLRVPRIVLECKGNWTNIHGVPSGTIENMRNRWENL